MLTREENELVTRVGPGTPMGDVFRRYWQPFLRSVDIPEVDGPPVRVELLGEKLVAFRDSSGKVGLVDEFCPHRLASMFYGINGDGGLLCIYHGWKFDREGRCTEMPSDEPDSRFKDKVRITSYPVVEAGGMLWCYMGPPEKQPGFPPFMYNLLPPEHTAVAKVPIYCNWLQSAEGNIDSTHLGTLHATYADRIPMDVETDQPGYPSPRFSLYVRASYRYAQVNVQDTDYGFRLIAVRPTDKGNQHLRINCHILPHITFIAAQRGQGTFHMTVPVNDEMSVRFSGGFNADRPLTEAERQAILFNNVDTVGERRQRAENDYLIDRRAQKTSMYAGGIWPIAAQDFPVTESMGGGAIVDRTKEHLYAADAAIIRLRQQLIALARNLREGIEPPDISKMPLDKIRSEEIIIGPDEDPYRVAAHAGERAGRGERLITAKR